MESEGKLKGVKRKIVEVVEEGFGQAAKRRKLVGVKEVKTTTTTTRSLRVSRSPKKPLTGKAKLVKKGIRRSTSAPVSDGLARKPSTLKKLLGRARSVKSAKSMRNARTITKRVVSGASAEMLLNKENKSAGMKEKGKGKAMGRSTSLKAKVGSLRDGVARSARR